MKSRPQVHPDDLAWHRIEQAIRSVSTDFAAVWRRGDGYGGAITDLIQQLAEEQGLHLYEPGVVPGGQRAAPPRLRIECFRRDGHACVICGATDDIRAARLPHAVGRQVTSVDDVVTTCVRHANSVRAGTEKVS